MFALTFNGRFELKNPEEFLQDMQELLKKHSAEYFGRIQTEKMIYIVNMEIYPYVKKIANMIIIMIL